MSLFNSIGSSWLEYTPTKRLLRVDAISFINKQEPTLSISLLDGSILRIKEVDWENEYANFNDLVSDVNTLFNIGVGGGGTFDPSLYSVTELNDVTNSGSGAIITTTERQQITTNQNTINALSSSYNRRQTVINLSDPTLPPVTEITGDRYILDFASGFIDNNWDGASRGDIVEYNGISWDKTSPEEGWIVYVDALNKDALYIDDGAPNWEMREVSITNHNDLGGKQGGSLGEYNHLTNAQIDKLVNISDNANRYIHPNHTGDVTSDGDGNTAISDGVVTNIKQANVPANTIKGNNTLLSGSPNDLTISQVRSMLFPERIVLSRTEAIDESTTTTKEYFTFVQNGTEISNIVTVLGGNYEMEIFFICRNTSNNGSIVVTPNIGGVNVFSESYRWEPKDGENINYVTIKKDVALLSGNNTINLNFSNINNGISRIYEANITLTQLF